MSSHRAGAGKSPPNGARLHPSSPRLLKDPRRAPPYAPLSAAASSLSWLRSYSGPLLLSPPPSLLSHLKWCLLRTSVLSFLPFLYTTSSLSRLQVSSMDQRCRSLLQAWASLLRSVPTQPTAGWIHLGVSETEPSPKRPPVVSLPQSSTSFAQLLKLLMCQLALTSHFPPFHSFTQSPSYTVSPTS